MKISYDKVASALYFKILENTKIGKKKPEHSLWPIYQQGNLLT